MAVTEEAVVAVRVIWCSFSVSKSRGALSRSQSSGPLVPAFIMKILLAGMVALFIRRLSSVSESVNWMSASFLAVTGVVVAVASGTVASWLARVMAVGGWSPGSWTVRVKVSVRGVPAGPLGPVGPVTWTSFRLLAEGMKS